MPQKPKLNVEAIKSLLRLYEIAYGFNIREEYKKHKNNRTAKANMVTPKDKCYLCEENRALQRAHIIPQILYKNAEVDGPLPEALFDAMYLCPTHHFCYDKYKLSDDEKKIIRASIKNYRRLFELLLENTEVTAGTNRGKAKIDSMMREAWSWWREYCYGN